MQRHELILGGQKSGKSRLAEQRAADWLRLEGLDTTALETAALAGARPGAAPARQAVLLATALPGDAEMAVRIARHQADRAQRVPRLTTVEAAPDLALALARYSRPERLVVIDCMTLWLTQLLMPLHGPAAGDAECANQCRLLLQALQQARGPVVLVSNEIGLGVSPLSAEARRFIDLQGGLHQQLAAVCERVTLMVAGCALAIKREIA